VLRPFLGFTELGRQGNTDTRERLQVQNIVEYVRDYQENYKRNTRKINADEHITKVSTELYTRWQKK
jgi:hypothetical protein